MNPEGVAFTMASMSVLIFYLVIFYGFGLI